MHGDITLYDRVEAAEVECIQHGKHRLHRVRAHRQPHAPRPHGGAGSGVSGAVGL